MKLYSSAYCVWPEDPNEHQAFNEALSACEWLAGVELGYRESIEWPDGIDPQTTTLVTGIPGATFFNAKNPTFGLASPDEPGLKAARDWAWHLCQDVGQLITNGHNIRAVQIHSAPTEFADKKVFRESLAELVTWDWKGVELWVEHCDAWVPGQKPNKGYLKIDDELEAVASVRDENPDVRLGFVVNWARSAIEGRDTQTPLDHIRRAADAGLLTHVGLSSCSGEETVFGEPWIDFHLPFAGLSFSPNGSLLGREELTQAIDAAGDVTFGLKVGLRPNDLPIAKRIDALTDMVHMVDQAVA